MIHTRRWANFSLPEASIISTRLDSLPEGASLTVCGLDTMPTVGMEHIYLRARAYDGTYFTLVKLKDGKIGLYDGVAPPHAIQAGRPPPEVRRAPDSSETSSRQFRG